MNDLLEEFVETYFTEEMQTQIKRSFDLFDFFDFSMAYQGFPNIITDESNLGSDGQVDRFFLELHKQLNIVLEQHSIKMIDTASIYEKNEIIHALAFIQHLEDYTGIIRTLETFEPNEVQLATILSELCMFDQIKIMELVETFNPRMLQTLKKFIYQKEEAAENKDPKDTKIVKHIKFFNSVFKEDNIGAQLARSNILIGEAFETYLDYIQDIVITPDDSRTALNILSVLYLSRDGFNSPLLVYRKYSYRLIQDLDKVSRVEVQLLNHIAKLNEYQKAEDEKVRFSPRSVEV